MSTTPAHPPCATCTLPEVVEWVEDSREQRMPLVLARWHAEGHPVSLDEYFLQWLHDGEPEAMAAEQRGSL